MVEVCSLPDGSELVLIVLLLDVLDVKLRRERRRWSLASHHGGHWAHHGGTHDGPRHWQARTGAGGDYPELLGLRRYPQQGLGLVLILIKKVLWYYNDLRCHVFLLDVVFFLV